MKSTILKLVAVVMALCMMLSFAACAKKDKEEPTTAQETTTEAETEIETEAETEAPAVVENRELVNAIGGCSETYKGTVSEKTYTDSNKAINDFVSLEVAGSDTQATVKEAKLEAKLTDKEIEKLDIPASDMQGAESVEKYIVTCELEATETEESTDGLLRLSDVKKTNTVVVYVISYGDYFKYFTPVLETGDTITKSYYDSIFNAEKYKNCTMVSESTMIGTMTEGGHVINMDCKYTTTVKYADNKIYYKEESLAKYSAEGQEDNQSSSIELFIEEDATGNAKCYYLLEGEWVEVTMKSVGFSSIEELTPFAQNYLDHTYFTKTSYGCKLNEENYVKYLKQVFADINISNVDMTSDNVKGSVDYFVSNGVLSAISEKVDLNLTVEGDSMNISLVASDKCTDYGTTTVESPIK